MVKLNKINVILMTLALIASSFGFPANAASAPGLGDQVIDVTGAHNIRIYVNVNPNGSSTDINFKYRTESGSFRTSTYGNVTSPMTTQNWGIVALLEGTTYVYQIEAHNSFGTTIGQSGTFTTPGGSTSTGGTTTTTSNNNNNNTSGNTNNTGSSQGAPLVNTNGPTNLSTNSATISGNVNPNGNSTSFWFGFGTTQTLGLVTTSQIIGSGNTSTPVTGNLTLESNRIYYYRVFARNSYGTSSGELWYLNTGTGQAGIVSGQGGTTTNQTGGQVLGAVSGSGTGTSTGSGTSSTGTKTTSGTTSSKTGTTTSATTKTTKPAVNTNPRPSFISMEYSLDSNGALVLVANNLKPKPGEEFSYTIITKNDNQTSFNETNLKVLLPTEVEYMGSNIEPLRISGTVIEYDLGTVQPMSQNATVITVRVKDTVKPGTSMIFTSVLGYKDSKGVQLATTSYMTVKVGQGGSGGISLSAFSLGSLASSTTVLVLVSLGLLILMALLTYKFVKVRNGKNGKDKKPEEKDIFNTIPSTFEPISDGSFPRR